MDRFDPSKRNAKHKYDKVPFMKTRSAKNKGRILQNKVAEMIRKIFDLPAEDVRPAIMGETGVDIKLSRPAKKAVKLAIECKNQERINVWEAMDQAYRNSGGEEPAVFIKRNRSEILAVVNGAALLDWLRELHELQTEKASWQASVEATTPNSQGSLMPKGPTKDER